MANIIHMETEVVRATARQLDQTSLEIHQMISALGASVRSMNWQSEASEQFFQEFRELERKIIVCADQGITLSTQVKREIDEWEQIASHLSGDSAGFSNPLLIIGGGALVIVGGVVWWGSQDLQKLSSDEAEARIEEILRRTPAGRDALKKADELGVDFEINQPGKGTYYDPDTDTMYVDPKTHPDLAAESYIHELQHAQQDAEGRLPDASAMSRDEYTERVLDIEAEALIKEYEYENERPVLDYLNPRVGEEAYEKTYSQTMKSLKESSPQMSAEEMHKLAYEAGKEEVKKFYRDGTITASTNQRSYVDNAHEFWDRVHAPQSSQEVI